MDPTNPIAVPESTLSRGGESWPLYLLVALALLTLTDVAYYGALGWVL
jgi:hypothetical protein